MSFPRMSWHIGDYLKDTGHLRAAEHGAYFLLCMHYWATGGLPDDDDQLAAIVRMAPKEWMRARPIIRAFFLEGWRHKRIDEELEQANEKYERRANAGSKGGKAKAKNKQKHSNATGNATANGYQPITDNPKEYSSEYSYMERPSKFYERTAKEAKGQHWRSVLDRAEDFAKTPASDDVREEAIRVLPPAGSGKS